MPLNFSYEKPFVAIYTVNADVVKKESDPVAMRRYYHKKSQERTLKQVLVTLLIEVIPYLAIDTLQELPFSDLSSSDLAMIIGKVPLDRAEVILNKIPPEKRQEILNGIPAERRQELGK